MRRASLLFIMFVTAATLFGGDLATFMNLGFSADSKFFAFGQYGIKDDRKASAQIQVVDVQSNSFVSGGNQSIESTHTVSIGQDGSSTLIKGILSQSALFARQGIQTDNNGRLIYILLNGAESLGPLQFKDFQSNVDYKVTLTQQATTTGASFSISLQVTLPNQAPKSYTIGRPTLVRPGITAYKVRQIILSPNEKSLVFVIERTHTKDQPLASSYMVETIAL